MSGQIQEYLVLKDIADIFKGYSITKLNESISAVIDNSDKTDSGLEDFVISEKVKVLGWKQIRNYDKTHLVKDECNVIDIGRKYNKNIQYMRKGDIVFPVFPSKDCIEMVYIEDEPEEKYIYNESVIVIRATDQSIDSKYIYIMCKSDAIQDKLLNLTGNTKTVMSRLTKEILSSIKIIKLTDIERKQIVDEYTNLLELQEKFNQKINQRQSL